MNSTSNQSSVTYSFSHRGVSITILFVISTLNFHMKWAVSDVIWHSMNTMYVVNVSVCTSRQIVSFSSKSIFLQTVTVGNMQPEQLIKVNKIIWSVQLHRRTCALATCIRHKPRIDFPLVFLSRLPGPVIHTVNSKAFKKRIWIDKSSKFWLKFRFPGDFSIMRFTKKLCATENIAKYFATVTDT